MTKRSKNETETQARIRQLREQINALDKDEVRPFTAYKTITYLCTVFFPPGALRPVPALGAENGIFPQGTDSLELGHCCHCGICHRIGFVGKPKRLPTPLVSCALSGASHPGIEFGWDIR